MKTDLSVITEKNFEVLDLLIKSESGIHLALIRALAAVVCADGQVSLPELSAVTEAATRLDGSNLSAYAALRLMEIRPPLDTSLKQLSSVSADLNLAQRNLLLKVATPIIELQGSEALTHAERFAEALHTQLPPPLRTELESQANAPFWKVLSTQAIRRMAFSAEIEAARDCYLVTRNKDLSRALAQFLNGEIDAESLDRTEAVARSAFSEALETVEVTIRDLEHPSRPQDALLDAARELQAQIEQRLNLIHARIELEKREFDEGVDELVNDAGNAFEVEAFSLFRNADKGKSGSWKHLARSSFGRELERRITRTERLYAQRLEILKKEVSIFSKDYGYAVTQILTRVHHTQLAMVMPSLRVGTRLLNAVEDIANLTIATGAVTSIGTGAAVYFLGAAAVAPVVTAVAPAVPLVAGALIVAALLKWIINTEARLEREIAHKRKSFDDELRKHLQVMRTSYFSQLDQTQKLFDETAAATIKPLLLEAYAQAGLRSLQKRLIVDVSQYSKQLLMGRKITKRGPV